MVEFARQEPLVEITCPFCFKPQMTPYTLKELNTLNDGNRSSKISDQCGNCGEQFFYRLGKGYNVVVSKTL